MQSSTLLLVRQAVDSFNPPGLLTVESKYPQHATLISNDYAVLSAHYLPPIGTAVTARTGKGEETSVVAGLIKIAADIALVQLKYPMESTGKAQIATEAEVRAKGAEFMGVGFTGTGTVEAVSVASRLTFQLITTDSADRLSKVILFRAGVKIEGGDSGSPVYVNVRGIWKLAAVWTAKSPTSNPASLLYPWKDAIDSLTL